MAGPRSARAEAHPTSIDAATIRGASSNAARARFGFSIAVGGAAVPASRCQRRIVEWRRRMSDEFCLRFDDACGPAIAVRKEPAELVDDFVGVQADGLRVIANEGTREYSGWPLGKVVAFEPEPEIGADFRDRHYGFDADPAPFTLAAQAGAEGVSVRHEELETEQRSSRTISTRDRQRSAPCVRAYHLIFVIEMAHSLTFSSVKSFCVRRHLP